MNRLVIKTAKSPVFLLLAFALLANPAAAQESQLATALAIKPNQSDLDFDQPAAAEAEKCQIERTVETLKIPGWRIKDSGGKILRQFLDTNKDGQLDVWSFYKSGIEVYRDIDSDFDKRTDQYRWLGTAGTRWGIDQNQDGVIDRWKSISSEEVAAEVFQAVRQRDRARFLRVLLTDSELESLKLGSKFTEIAKDAVGKAAAEFEKFASSQKTVSSNSEFVHFGSAKPGAVPQLTDGLEQDQIVYDHASAVFQTDKEFGQLALGTLIKVGDSWRAMELPTVIESGKAVANGGLFFSSPDPIGIAASTPSDSSIEKLSPLLEEFERIEKQLNSAKGDEIAKLEQERSNLFLELIKASTNKDDRNNWVRLAADAITNAYQESRFDDGLKRLEQIKSTLAKEKVDVQLDYVDWRVLTARFSQALQGDAKARASANEKYLQDLKEFVTQYKSSEFAPEAMMQLALYAEVSEGGDLDAAVSWYSKIEETFPDTLNARRARGAKLRLTSTGKPISFKGKTINGKVFDLASKDLRGKIVVIHYWASWCDACLNDFEALQRLSAKYREDLVIVGVNIDDDQKLASDALAKKKSAVWTQLYEPGGMNESPLALQLGVSTLPLTIVIDKEGNLADSNALVADLDRSIQRLSRGVESTARKN